MQCIRAEKNAPLDTTSMSPLRLLSIRHAPEVLPHDTATLVVGWRKAIEVHVLLPTERTSS